MWIIFVDTFPILPLLRHFQGPTPAPSLTLVLGWTVRETMTMLPTFKTSSQWVSLVGVSMPSTPPREETPRTRLHVCRFNATPRQELCASVPLLPNLYVNLTARRLESLAIQESSLNARSCASCALMFSPVQQAVQEEEFVTTTAPLRFASVLTMILEGVDAISP